MLTIEEQQVELVIPHMTCSDIGIRGQFFKGRLGAKFSRRRKNPVGANFTPRRQLFPWVQKSV
jgi:hypothetical protein